MTIIDLQEAGITIQGPCRVSSIDRDGNEVVLYYDELVYGFPVVSKLDGELERPWLASDITYIFVGADGVLHIEVEGGAR